MRNVRAEESKITLAEINMGTQAVVSIVRGGKVELKIVAGCEGSEADRVAEKLLGLYRRNPGAHPIAAHTYRFVRDLGLGCGACLVVVNDVAMVSSDEIEDDLSPLYRETFDNPTF